MTVVSLIHFFSLALVCLSPPSNFDFCVSNATECGMDQREGGAGGARVDGDGLLWWIAERTVSASHGRQLLQLLSHRKASSAVRSCIWVACWQSLTDDGRGGRCRDESLRNLMGDQVRIIGVADLRVVCG